MVIYNTKAPAIKSYPLYFLKGIYAVKVNNFISAVIYTHNYGNSIANTLSALSGFLSEHFVRHEIICVNDSSDNTIHEIKAFAKANTDVSVTLISAGYYQGGERAMNAGIDCAIGDFVLQFDTAIFDFELPLIMDVYNHCLQGFDIVNVSPNRKVSGATRLFYNLFNKYSHTQYPLSSETFRIISRRGINRVGQMGKVIFYRKAMYASCGLKSDTLTYTAKRERAKYTKQERSFRRELAIDSFILFTDFATKISMLMCVIMLLWVMFCSIYVVGLLIMGRTVDGWGITMLLLSTGLFGISVILAISIKYLSMILNLVFEKQKYVVENVEKL